MASLDELFSNVWVAPFPGFDPDLDGTIGFSEKMRHRFLKEMFGETSLVCIVEEHGWGSNRAADQEELILGLVEVTRDQVDQATRVDPDHYSTYDPADDHSFALAMRRAWKVQERLPARCLLGEDERLKSSPNYFGMGAKLPRPVAKWFLTKVTLKETSIYKSPPIREDAPIGSYMRIGDPVVVYGPSKVFPPSLSPTRAGATPRPAEVLYLATVNLGADVLAGQPLLEGEKVWKFGISANPYGRVEELSSGFPPKSKIEWDIRDLQRFGSEAEARVAEEKFRRAAEKNGSLGGEFMVLEEEKMARLFREITGRDLGPKV